MATAHPSNPCNFLDGGGETATLICAFDWSKTPLGPIEQWPQSLKTATSLILRSTVPIVMLWGDEGRMIYNDAYSVFAGGRHPTLLGSRVREGWPEVADFNDNVMNVGLAGGTLTYTDQELTLHRHGGPEQVWMDLNYSPVVGEDGRPAGVIAVVIETTERVLATRKLAAEREELEGLLTERAAAEAALRQSEGRLRLVIEGAKDHAIFTTDPDGIVTTWSPGAAAIFGWTEEEISGRSLSRLYTPEDVAQGVDVAERLTAAREGCANDERWHMRKDGSRVFMNGSVHPLPPGRDGKPKGFIKIARDETERRRTDEALRALNADLERQVVERAARLAERTAERELLWRNSQDLLVVIDTAGAFQDVSFAATRILGWAPDEMIGKSVFDFIHPDDVAPTLGALKHAAGDELPIFENRYRHRDGGYRWLSWVAAPAGELIYATARHITVEKEQAQALAQAQEALRQSQKMEAIGQLTGGIAHDFNNLLAGISGSLELLELRLGQGRLADAERYINGAQVSAKRAAALTQRLLAFSRRQTLDPRPTDINKLIFGMEDLIRRTVGPAVEVEVVGAGGLWTARVDAPQLENALLNLAINARDAMPEGGRITIETANKWLDDRAGPERELPPGQYLSICVTDTGSGMTPEVIERAFEPFFTTKPLGQGTGLGLSMIHGFVRQSGGQVRIYSELGKGTTMCLYLPRFMGEADEDADQDSAHPVEAIDGETVLVVDDEPTVRGLILEVLTEAGYHTLEAEDGPAGLKILRSDARVDLLITDVGLPGGMNGRQVADAARELRPDLKVLFVTGYAENAAVGNGHLEAGMEVITKPFVMADLGAKVREMIER